MWFFEFNFDDLKSVPARRSLRKAALHCWKCSADLTAQVERNGLKLGGICDTCDSEIHAPLKPPKSLEER